MMSVIYKQQFKQQKKADTVKPISYTTSEIYTIDYFVKLAKELSQTGADSICIMIWRRFDATNGF